MNPTLSTCFKVLLLLVVVANQAPKLLAQAENYELFAEQINGDSPPAAKTRKCNPMLDLSTYMNSSQEAKNARRPSKGLSFAINNIDFQLNPLAGSVNSALKLLSSIDRQLGFADDSENDNEGDTLEERQNLVKFRENVLHIQGINLNMLNIHLFNQSDPKFGVGLSLSNTTLSGSFSYDGSISSLASSKLSGFYRMSIENINLVANSNLTKEEIFESSSDLEQKNFNNDYERKKAIQSTKFQLKTNDFKMNITNLGFISIEILDSHDSSKQTTNYLLKMLQRVLQKSIKKTYYSFENYIRSSLELEGRHLLDCELTRFNPLLDPTSPSSHLTDLARIISNEISRSRLNTVHLPNFNHRQSVFGSIAFIELTNGSLAGLDGLVLNGETKIKLQDEHLLINASIGWKHLQARYNWTLSIGSTAKEPTTSGFVSFNLSAIDFDSIISKGIRPKTRIVVEQLLIKRLDSPRMDMSGLPGVNRLTRSMVNFFMARLKQRLSGAIQPTLKQQLERSLNKMSLFG